MGNECLLRAGFQSCRWKRSGGDGGDGRCGARPCVTRDPTDCSCQAPQPMGFPRQERWSGVPLPPPGDLSQAGKIKPASLECPALAGRLLTSSATWKARAQDDHTAVWRFSVLLICTPTDGSNGKF